MVTAERYWLLRFEDDELRFSERAGAERWADTLAARGIVSHLTHHDENTPTNPQDERRVA